jgi:hypothetical protein
VAQTPALNVGFLTVLQEPTGYVGGYFVTNDWGRPVEFRVSSAVHPNRVQQILYGDTLRPYLCGELIGRTLVEKTAAAAHLIVTDTDAALEVRAKVEVPVVWLVPADDPRAAALAAGPACVRPPRPGRGPIVCHPRFPDDVPGLQETLTRLQGVMDLGEPFARIREAIIEARKAGAGQRPAAA